MFTDPPLAHVGLTERRAEADGVAVRIAKLPTSAVLRTEATGETQGFMKAVISADDDLILGFTMVGAEAGEVMAAVQTAMLANLPYQKLRDAILTHPTMAEGLGPLLENVPPRSDSAKLHRPSIATTERPGPTNSQLGRLIAHGV
jgi:pyruvate/2-oxoglutarate dehydrogenase complex dihydrolipoamide dehydrogenase (E3) component